jgi:hypothetical protein
MSANSIENAPPINTSTSTMPDLDVQTFTLFPKFPAELQLKIWEMAMPGPRVIKIGYLRELGNFPLCQKSPKIPSLLHACHDSRAVALNKIKPHFENASLMPIYCDFEKDTILLMNTATLRTISMRYDLDEERQQMRFLALRNAFSSGTKNGLRGFTALQAAIFARPFWSTPNLIPSAVVTQFKRKWRYVQTMEEETVAEKDGKYLPRCSLITEADMEAFKDEDQYWK